DLLNIPSHCKNSSSAPFGRIFDSVYKKNPSKKFKPEDEDSIFCTTQGYIVNKNKFARRFELTQATMFTSLEVLYQELAKLQQQMAEIHNAITELAKSIPSTFQSSFEGVKQKEAVKDTLKTDSNDRLRRFQVFLRNLESKKDDVEEIKEICEKIEAPFPVKFFRLRGKEGIRPVILKRGKNPLFPSLVARPNYSPEEEKTNKSAWADACSRNDSAGRKEYIVKNLKVIKLEKPGEWTARDRP
ncbi:hypothetical protein PMAYCL1PPCAC_08648, partial [Pristionchus mayeri]